MCGTMDQQIIVNPQEARALLEQGYPKELLLVSGPIPTEGGHAPAVEDNRFPRMEVKKMGGKPSRGTKKDKRLKENKRGNKK